VLFEIKRRRLEYFGHIIRKGKYRLLQLVMEGKIEGRRRPGRKKTSWLKNLRDWYGQNSVSLFRSAAFKPFGGFRARIGPPGERSRMRQENEYVDITQVQQLLLDSATTSGKGASSKNRTSESQSRDCQQQFTQEQLTSRSLSFSETNKAPIRTVLRPHSQPSCSTLPGDYSKSQQGFFRSPDRLYPQQGRQIEYFSRIDTGRVQPQDQTGKPRMLAEGLPTPPHLQPPTPSTGGHSPNVEELFALWFGTPSGNAGWFFFKWDR
jgi:hypothetical protein